MSAMNAARFIARRLSSSGRVLREEEKKAENVFNKFTFDARGPKAAEKTPAKPVHSSTDVKPTNPHGSSSSEALLPPKVLHRQLLLHRKVVAKVAAVVLAASESNGKGYCCGSYSLDLVLVAWVSTIVNQGAVLPLLAAGQRTGTQKEMMLSSAAPLLALETAPLCHRKSRWLLPPYIVESVVSDNKGCCRNLTIVKLVSPAVIVTVVHLDLYRWVALCRRVPNHVMILLSDHFVSMLV
ncbi:hypothetical protein ZIOFF_069670 [Zingiber officinale]|uniref:Uncharacterized protein n=1 Tax=Zingiber officinale TaxID=94328 RepID=A0A8J5CW30_ZINOF|nr:hypothetical protein ZIOFF_069670 [Zingiber officinale]